jgi:uncharacterized membrane protein YkvI
MNNAEIERSVARVALPRLVAVMIACATMWVAGSWLGRVASDPASIWYVTMVGLAWLLRASGRAGTISIGILILLYLLHWTVNTCIARRSRNEQAIATDVVVLSYSWPFKIISFTSFGFAIFCAAVFLGSPNDRSVGIGLTAGFLVGGCVALVAYNLPRIRVWSYGIDVERPFRPRQIPWISILGADIKKEYLVLAVAASPPLRISIHMRNADHLFDELERRHIAVAGA